MFDLPLRPIIFKKDPPFMDKKLSHYYFLASPYKGTEEEKSARYDLSKKIVALFLEQQISVFAPILYNQAIISFFPNIKADNRCNLLMPMNIEFLRSSKAIFLLKIPGWETSWGLQQYFRVAKEESLKIYDLYLETLDDDINRLIALFHRKNL